MSAKVTLTIKEGTEKGRVFTFLSHDTFLLGRMDDCHAYEKEALVFPPDTGLPPPPIQATPG